MPTIHKGGCLCGAVEFTIEGEPREVTTCHCPACQHRSGSLFSVGVSVEGFQVKKLDGELNTYRSYCDDVGSDLAINFCPVCGVTVSWTASGSDSRRWFALGAFDDSACFEIGEQRCLETAHRSLVYPG